MVGKHEKRGICWCKARIFWDYYLGYTILLTLWQQSFHYSRDLVLFNGFSSYHPIQNEKVLYKKEIDFQHSHCTCECMVKADEGNKTMFNYNWNNQIEIKMRNDYSYVHLKKIRKKIRIFFGYFFGFFLDFFFWYFFGYFFPFLLHKKIWIFF